jgi:hypothetical protein
MPMTHNARSRRGFSLSRLYVIALVGAVAVCRPADIAAQTTALVSVSTAAMTIEYAANESGGRIRLTSASPDSAAIEAARALLIENAAAFRRGDLKGLRIVRADLPAMQILADRREALRCTVRMTARGGDLVLLSDDSAVVDAIHQILASTPPRSATY